MANLYILVRPGLRLKMPSSSDAHSLVSAAISKFISANLALFLFDQEYHKPRSSPMDSLEDAESRRREATLKVMRSVFKGIEVDSSNVDHFLRSLSRESYENIINRVGETIIEEEWRNGRVPREMEFEKRLLFAHSFLDAVSMLGNLIGKIASEDSMDSKVIDACGIFDAEFPQIKRVRNSAQHLEDRIRRKGPGNKPMPIKPITATETGGPLTEKFIKVEGSGSINSLLVTSGLINRHLSYTTMAGIVEGIEVSDDTLIKIHKILQDILNALPWAGEPTPVPRYS